LATKAFIPWFVDDDFACKVLDDSGNATTDDTDDNGKPAPDVDSAKCKCPEFAKAILATLDILLPHALMPVHALLACDAATEPLLPDHFLPNAETGPPGGIALGATAVPRAVWPPGPVTRPGFLRLACLARAAEALGITGSYPTKLCHQPPRSRRCANRRRILLPRGAAAMRNGKHP
jgi:hypothetical protein